MFSQTESFFIAGSVIDKSTQEPLASCLILLANTTIGTNTDIDGNFKLSLPLDTSIIKVACIGYKTVYDTIIPSIKNSIILSYALEQDIYIHDDFGIWLTKQSAIRDISNNLFIIYEHFADSLKLRINQLAFEYGFSFKWFGEKGYVLSVEDYNNYVIAALENRNGKNWYEVFRKKLNKILGVK